MVFAFATHGKNADHHRMSLHAERKARLEATTGWAARIRSTLGEVLQAHAGEVHFRPGSTGVSMVGLLPDRPQRGKSGLKDLIRVARDFDALFAAHCRDIEQGRITGEKALQSAMIAEAYRNQRRLKSINDASQSTSDPVELLFVTDEISLPVAGGKLVCDVLALRRDGGRCTPVLLELKDARMLTRLLEQVESYAALIDEHAEWFAKLFEAVVGEAVEFDGPAEKWIVWPKAGEERDPREVELAERGVRVVGYEVVGGGYGFRAGCGVRP